MPVESAPERVPLNRAETAILATLTEAGGDVVGHRELCRAAWGSYEARGERHRLKSAVHRLRRKLDEGLTIQSARGEGYRLIPTNSTTTPRSTPDKNPMKEAS